MLYCKAVSMAAKRNIRLGHQTGFACTTAKD